MPCRFEAIAHYLHAADNYVCENLLSDKYGISSDEPCKDKEYVCYEEAEP